MDGKLSTSVLVACIVPILFVLIGVFSTNHSLRTPSPSDWGIAEIVFCIGFIVSISVSVAAYRGKWTTGPRAKGISQKPKLLFLWLFGIIVILNSAIDMAININCIEQDGVEPFHGDQMLSVFSHLVEILFFASQLGFIAYFINFRFSMSVILNYSLSIMLITHLVTWFHSVLSSLFRHGILQKANYTMLNSTDCFWQSEINSLRTTLRTYSHPAATEYSLLSAAFLLRMWPVVDPKSFTIHLSELNALRSEANEGTPLMQHQQMGRYITDRQTVSNGGFSIADAERNWKNSLKNGVFSLEDMSQMTDRSSRSTPSFYIVILVGIGLSTPVLVAAMILLTIGKIQGHIIYVWEVIQCLFTLVHLLILTIALYGMRKICRISLSLQDLKDRETILILTAGCTVALDTFILLAGIHYQGEGHYIQQTAQMFVFGNIVDIIGVYLQTVLIIQSARCSPKSKSIRTCFKLEDVYLMLLITNLVAWFCRTFLGSLKDSNDIIERQLYANYWPFILEVFIPFVIFYRFHSFMDMYEHYKKFQLYRRWCENEEEEITVVRELDLR